MVFLGCNGRAWSQAYLKDNSKHFILTRKQKTLCAESQLAVFQQKNYLHLGVLNKSFTTEKNESYFLCRWVLRIGLKINQYGLL